MFGWISTSGMPVRAIIFIVYAATIGWSLGFVTALLVGYGRGTLPNVGYLAAVLWGFAQQGSASWLFAKERDAGTHVYELMMVFGLFISVWLVRQSMESSRRIGQGAGVACARLILIYVLSAIVCAGLLELGNAKH